MVPGTKATSKGPLWRGSQPPPAGLHLQDTPLSWGQGSEDLKKRRLKCMWPLACSLFVWAVLSCCLCCFRNACQTQNSFCTAQLLFLSFGNVALGRHWAEWAHPYIRPHEQGNEQGTECLKGKQNDKTHTNYTTKRLKHHHQIMHNRQETPNNTNKHRRFPKNRHLLKHKQMCSFSYGLAYTSFNLGCPPS